MNNDYTFVWIQNITLLELCYWAQRGELEKHIFRKSYMSQFYVTDVVKLGPPHNTKEQGLIGIYAIKKD